MPVVDRSSPEPALVLVNPTASRVAEPERRARIVAVVAEAVERRLGRPPSILQPPSAEAGQAGLAAAVSAGCRLVVAIGGDGTVRDAAAALIGTEVPLAIVPAGTANLLAATVGVPMRLPRAAAAIVDGRVARVDVGRARWADAEGVLVERVFVVAIGMGFDARLMAATGHVAKRHLGRYGYFAAALGLLRHVQSVAVRLGIDGEEDQVRAIQVLVANGGELVPGVLRPALRIDPGDGLLDVFVVEGDGLRDGIVGGLEAILRRGTGASRTGRSRRLRGLCIRVSSDPALPVEVDGDVVGSGWFEAECLPHALRVVVPGRADRASGAASVRRP